MIVLAVFAFAASVLILATVVLAVWVALLAVAFWVILRIRDRGHAAPGKRRAPTPAIVAQRSRPSTPCGGRALRALDCRYAPRWIAGGSGH
jgi:hypothetical protein